MSTLKVDTITNNAGTGPVSFSNGFSGSNIVGQANMMNLGLAASVGASALTINLKQNDGSTNPSSSSPTYISFRSSTITTGAFNQRSVTGSLSLVVPSGATLGTVNGAIATLYLYALDNSGTVELAISGSLYDEAQLQTTTTISAGSSSNSTIYSTTGRSSVPVRLIGRVVSTQTTAGTWASAPSELTIAPFFKLNTNHELILDTWAGYGATNTLLIRWTNATYNGEGKTAFTWTQDSTNGDSVTINRSGLVCISGRGMAASGAADGFGLSLNQSGNNSSLSATSGFFLNTSYNSGTAGQNNAVIMRWMTAGDVIRFNTHNGGTPQNSAWLACRFMYLGQF